MWKEFPKQEASGCSGMRGETSGFVKVRFETSDVKLMNLNEDSGSSASLPFSVLGFLRGDARAFMLQWRFV